MPEKSIQKEMEKRSRELLTLEDKEDMLKKNIAELEIDKLKPRDYNSMKEAVKKIEKLGILEKALNRIKKQRAFLTEKTWKLIPEYNKRIREEGEKTKKTGRFRVLKRR